MKITNYIVLWVFATIIFGCQKPGDPYISKAESNALYAAQNPAVQNVAFIYNNEVYFLADFDNSAQKITSSGGIKKFVKVSHDHTKFAYQNVSGNVEIIDKTGKLITTLNYSGIKSFDWTADDKTLFILSNDNLYYYGTALNLSITYPGITPGYTTEILSASISLKGDFAYIIHYSAYTYGDKYRLVIKPAGGGTTITYDNNTVPYSMNYVQFSANLQDMTVGYRDPTYSANSFERVEFFTGLGAYPKFSFESSSTYGTPVYNSTLNYTVCTVGDANSGKFTLSAFANSSSLKTKIQAQYTTTGNGLYTDWK